MNNIILISYLDFFLPCVFFKYLLNTYLETDSVSFLVNFINSSIILEKLSIFIISSWIQNKTSVATDNI